MLGTQKEYVQICDNVHSAIRELDLSEEITSVIEDLRAQLGEAELVVPVIGSFSSGKSTLLNSFLGETVLPVGITPETSIATELRYSPNACIEAIRSDDQVERFSIDEFDRVKDNAHNYKYVKLYLPNNGLKSISPLVPVDMPGFDSPLDLHNRAILTYIQRGSHFVVLTSVEDGNITRSMIRQLDEVYQFRRGFSSFLSKANLRTQDEVSEIVDYIDEQLKDGFGLDARTTPIGQEGGTDLERVLQKIDPETLFGQLYQPSIKSMCYDVMDELNTRISALKRTKEENEEVLAELASSREAVGKQASEMLASVQERYSNPAVQGIVAAVSRELSSSIDELVQGSMSGGGDAVSSQISELVRHTLLTEIRSTIEDAKRNIVGKLSSEVKNIGSLLNDDGLVEERVAGFVDSVRFLGISKKEQASDGFTPDKTHLLQLGAAVAAITTSVVAPIVEAVIVLLPSLLKPLFSNMREQRQREEIRQQLLTSVFPKVKADVQARTPGLVSEQIGGLIHAVEENLESEIEQKRQGIEASEAERMATLEETKAILNTYEEALAEVRTVTTRLFPNT